MAALGIRAVRRSTRRLRCRRWLALWLVQAWCAAASAQVPAAAPPSAAPSTPAPAPAVAPPPQAASPAAPSPARESTVKAAFLYRFGSFVEWPAEAFAGPGDPLVVGVVGDDFVAADLEQIAAGRTVEGRPVQVVRLREPQTLERLHILYLGNLRPARLREFVPPSGAPVLLVSEREEAARLGSALYFSMDGGRVRFSAVPAAAESRGLRLSARLLAVAQHVQGHSR